MEWYITIYCFYRTMYKRKFTLHTDELYVDCGKCLGIANINDF